MSGSLCKERNIMAHQPNEKKTTAPQKPTHKPICLEMSRVWFSVRSKQPSRRCKMGQNGGYFGPFHLVKPINSQFAICYRDNGNQR